MRTEPAGPHPTGTRTVQPYDARFPQHRPVRGAGARIVRPVAPSSVQPHGAKPELSTRREPERTRILSSGEILQPRRSVASSRVSSSEGERRDPFRLPEVPDEKVGARHLTEQGTGAALPPGARGLLVSQLKLQGVVREQDGNKMIAVVTNETNRAYFLTENESLYNGVVSKITPDAVYFKENVLGTAGRVKTREVVKRLGSAPGEGR